MKNGFRWSLIALGLLVAFGTHASTPDRTSTITYNPQGLIDTVDGPRTDVTDITHYTYDAQGRLWTLTDALGRVTTYDTYNSYGNPGRVVDPNQVVTVMTYTPQGWLATTTRDSTGTPATTTLTYSEVGDVIQSKDADGVVVNYTYDDARRLTDITDGAGNYIHYTLDAAGNRLKEETFDSTKQVRRTVTRTYNSLSQVLTVVDALNRTVLSYDTTDGYDAAGHPKHSSDAAGVQRKQGYDALDRLVSTISNYNGTDTATQNTQSVSSYDASDNLEGVSDPDGLNTIYDHDGLGNLTGLHSPDTGTSTYLYDAAGNVTQRTDAKGTVSTIAYDALNRATSVSYGDTTLNITYAYDEANATTGCTSSFPLGRLTRLIENAVTTVFCYDARGNITQKRQIQGSQSDTTRYGYTLAGRLSSVTSPSLVVTQYSRDALGQISGVSVTPSGSAGQTVVSAISYLPFGPITSYTLGNGQTVARSYDANYLLTDITSPALNLHFARDAMGNITALGNTPGANPATETYSYDPLYRLGAVNSAAGTAIEAYTYNKTGDRLSKTSSGLATGTYGYQSSTHWLTSIGNAARTYDANGNTTASATGGDTYGYGYNGRNRLIVVQRNGVTVGSYSYNALGQRIAKTATLPQAISQRFVYDEASQLMGEYGTTNRDYIWLGNLPVAVVDTNGTTNTMNYVHADGLGTPRAISDASGVTQWQWSYQSNPFGEQQPTSSTGYTFNLRFPGQYYDVETGLHYNVNRDYASSTGRYIQSDPLGPQAGPSTYAYVSGNPLSNIDPLGLESPSAACGGGPGTSAWANCGDIPKAPPAWCNDSAYWDRYRTFVSDYAINVGPAATALAGGVWPKSWAPAGGFRGPLLGSRNVLTSVPRAFGMPGGSSALVQGGAAGIGVATVGIGMYDATIEVEGFYYAAKDAPSPSSKCLCGN
ncbi:RHS repeat protein [Dyella tabacisoli]|nr:RHS repeat protein [Dyella tabacisoli]